MQFVSHDSLFAFGDVIGGGPRQFSCFNAKKRRQLSVSLHEVNPKMSSAQ